MRLGLTLMSVYVLCIAGCGQVSKTVIYNDHTYKEVSKAENVRITHIDGKTFGFYRMEVITVDDHFIYARCWEKKKSEPIDYKFNKQEVIIESTSFSGAKTANYIFFTAVTVGLIIFLNIILSK